MFGFLVKNTKENLKNKPDLKEIVVEKDNRDKDVVLNINYIKENVRPTSI
jgi:hypothetical protein